MRKTTIIIAIILSAVNVYGQHLFVQNLNNVATITFLDSPEIKKIDGYNIYVLKKDHLTYLAEASPMSQDLRDLFSSGGLDSTYNGFIQGFIKSTKGKLIYKKTANSGDLSGVEFACVAFKGDQKYYSRNRVFFFNNILIDYSIISVDSLQNGDKRLNTFFNSFKITIKSGNVRQDNASELGYRAGTVIGYLIIITIMLSIGGLIVFSMIKFVNRSTR